MPVSAAGAPTGVSPTGGMAQAPDLPPPSAAASDVMQAPSGSASFEQLGPTAPPQDGTVPAAGTPPYMGSGLGTGLAPAANLPATRLAQPEIIRILTLRQLGVTVPMTLRGFSPLQGLDIPIPADEIVTRAQIVLDGAMSPSLLPEASSLTLTLNEQYVGTVLGDIKNSRFGPLVFDIDPIFFYTA